MGSRSALRWLVLIGTILRIWAVGHARFTGDESLFWAQALQIVRGVDWPSFGPPLTGSQALHPGPLFYYLLAIPQLLGDSPRWGGAFVAVLHGLSALALIAWLRAACGPRAAVYGAALWALMPWDVLYADRIWLGNLMGPLAILAFYAAERSRSERWLLLLVAALVVAPQIHMSAPALWVACAVRVWLEPDRKLSPRAIMAGVAVGALFYTPALISELQTGFVNAQLILSQGGGQARPLDIARLPLRVLGTAFFSGTSEIGYHFRRAYWFPVEARAHYNVAGARAWLTLYGLTAPLQLASIGLAAWAWASGLAHVWRARGGIRNDPFARAWLAVIAGLVAATVLLMIARKVYYPHYLLYFFPTAIVPLVRLSTSVEGRRRSLALGLFGASLLAMGINVARYYREVDTLDAIDVVECVAARLATSPEPLRLVHRGFDNRDAVRRVLDLRHHRGDRLRDDAASALIVHNDRLADPDAEARCGEVAISIEPATP